MLRQTSIAKSIDVTDRNAQYDQACKRLLANRIILAWILKETTKEFKDCTVEEIAFHYIQGTPEISTVRVSPGETNTKAPEAFRENLIGLNTEDNVYQEGAVTYDIHFQARCPEGSQFVKVFVNVEAQKDFYPGYALQRRGIFYCCRMISAQYETEFTEADYNEIKKVYSIWICMNPSKKAEHSITKYRICKEPVIGNLPDREDMYDLLTVVMICLGHDENGENSGILKLLDVLFSKDKHAFEKKQVLEQEFGIEMTRAFREETNLMCNLSEWLIETVTEEVTEEVTKKVTKEVTEKVTEKVTKKVTETVSERFSKLNLSLLKDKRYADLEKASEDKEYREQLFLELGI